MGARALSLVEENVRRDTEQPGRKGSVAPETAIAL